MRLTNLFEKSTRVRVIDKLRLFADDPTVYVSFQSIEKLGINPRSQWSDPFAVYAYPVKELFPMFEQGMYPFASTRKVAYVFRATGRVQELQEYSTEQLERDMDTIIEKFRPLLIGEPKDDGDDPEVFFYSLYQSWLKRWGGAPGRALWLMTGRMASFIERNHPNRDARVIWNAMFRSIGMDGIVDRGESIISTNEPEQGVFFHVRAFQVLEALHNDLVPVGDKTVDWRDDLPS